MYPVAMPCISPRELHGNPSLVITFCELDPFEQGVCIIQQIRIFDHIYEIIEAKMHTREKYNLQVASSYYNNIK